MVFVGPAHAAVDRGEDGVDECRDLIGRVVGAMEELRLELEGDQAVRALDLDRQLADLDAMPADDLAGRRADLRPAR